MKLSPAQQHEIRVALAEVTIRSQVAEQCPDTEATLKALREVSWAAIRAADLIRTAERETREAHLRSAA